MKRIKLLSPAKAEIRAAMVWYESRKKGLGVEFVAVLDEALQAIAARPESAPLWRLDRPWRRWVVRRFPYLVFFDIGSDVVTVVAVAHQRRRPGYWLKR